MSRENVEAFYERLATDDAFKQLLQSVNSKEECSQVVKEHGYEFTQQELEDYTANLLESINDDLVDLDEKELEAVMGGLRIIKDEYWSMPKPINPPIDNLPFPQYHLMYGVIIDPSIIQPLYGVFSSPID